MIRKRIIYHLPVTLLLCVLQVAGIGVFAQEPIIPADSLTRKVQDINAIVPVDRVIRMDSLIKDSVFSMVADSIEAVNVQNLEQLAEGSGLTLLSADSIAEATPEAAETRRSWVPDSGRATWLAVVFPGGGQIYNRKLWKLPIIYGGFVGCAYALSWNNKMFTDYSQAYVDIMDGDPGTNSYYNLLPPSVVVDQSTDTQWASRLQRQKNYYRRYRDISIFAFIGVYLISIIDAYVDAELSDFDIGPDLSFKIEPAMIQDKNSGNFVGIQCSIKF